jgi:hypothetical protein
MAVSRLSQQSLQQAFPKGNTFWDGTTATSAFDNLGTVLLSASASSVTFSNIPATYTHLQIKSFARSTRTSTGGFDQAFVRFNGDSGTNYSSHYLEANGTSATAGGSADISNIWGAVNMPWAGYTANSFGVGVLDILDYANTNKNKTAKTLAGFDANGSGFLTLWSGSWRNNSAITSITLVAQNHLFAEYSSFSLYGIK